MVEPRRQLAGGAVALLATGLLVACDGPGRVPRDGGPDGDEADGGERLPPPECPVRHRVEPPACGTEDGAWESLVPGPSEAAHEPALAERADRFDRQLHLLNALGTGVSADLTVPLEWTDERALVEAFLRESESWDLEAETGLTAEDLVSSWHKVAGAYAGVGVAADAFRYAVARDSGAACEEVDRARAHLEAGLEALHLATAITGVPGVIARGFARADLPGHGEGIETVPLFDGAGNPLPEEKDNGTWRDDNSGGLYPGYVWEDSCSRDQLVGWVVGMAAAFEVVELDPTFDGAALLRLRQDAAAIARSLMQVGERGFDLEIRDADGRVAYHGYLHEEALDRIYLPPTKNGVNAIMALGIVAALAVVSGEADVHDYLWNDLVRARRLHEISRDEMYVLDVGTRANFSGHNMLFAGGWLASRYLCDAETRAVVAEALDRSVYNRSPMVWPPSEQGQTLYDFVYVAARAGATMWDPLGPDVDEPAVERGLETLRQFADPPFWDFARESCDEAEAAALACEAEDGTPIELLGFVGWNDELVSAEPLPMRLRPPSNYFWRSSPYDVNGGGSGAGLLPGVDFRFVYWMGRYLRR